MGSSRPKKATKEEPASARIEFPKFPLEKALAIPNALSRNGGQPLPPIDVATAIDRSPGSSAFRQITGSSNQYGLTGGSYKADRITLAELGQAAMSPKAPEERAQALVHAALRPRLFRSVYDYYKGKKFPERQFLVNTVVRDFGVPAKQADVFVDVFVENMRFVGLIRETPGGDWLSKDATPESTSVTVSEDEVTEIEAEEEAGGAEESAQGEGPGSPPPPPPSEPEKKRRPNVLFVGHGKNKKPLDQLTKTLEQLGIPYKVAEAEPNLGRPISTKVRQTMEECGAGILIFTADREYQDKEGGAVWLSSENVANELGAAAVMYDDRIIIFKEEEVELASNYSGVGYITFEKNKLDAKVPDLLRELVAMKILKVSVDED